MPSKVNNDKENTNEQTLFLNLQLKFLVLLEFLKNLKFFFWIVYLLLWISEIQWSLIKSLMLVFVCAKQPNEQCGTCKSSHNKIQFLICDSWGSFRSHWRKANWRFAYANEKMQIVDLLFSCASWIFFRRHRNNDILNEFGRYIYKSGDYYIGEFKGGCRHEHGWFAYIAIIHNNFLVRVSILLKWTLYEHLAI